MDITQAFDKVWHTGLLYKLKKQLPHELYRLLKSYLENRHFYVNYQDERSKLQDIQSGIPQGSVLGPTLYLIYTADIPIAENTAMATFADDTALLAAHEDPEVASRLLQVGLHQIQNWLKLWRVRANESKSVQITFTTRKGKCPSVYLNNKPLPQVDSVKYLGIHLDKRLTWRSHIWAKRKQLGLKMRSMYWLIEKKSQLSAKNKILLYKTILKPIWTYGIQLWGTAKISNIQIIQRFQSKVLRTIANAPWYVTNECLHSEFQIKTVNEVIKEFSQKYKNRLQSHPNKAACELLTESDKRRLKRYRPLDLPNRKF